MNTKARMAMVVLAVSIAGAAVTARAGGAADYWMVDDGREIDNESIVFVDQSVRLDQRPDGWINFSYYEARNGSRAGVAKSMWMTAWANCKTREYINDYRMEYDSGGHMVAEGKVSEQQRRVPAPGSAEGRVLAFVCGDIRGATQLPRGTHFITYADSLYAQGHPQVARAPAPQASPRPPSPVAAPSTAAAPAAPGIGKANWKNLAYFDDLAYFVQPANLKPGGPTGRGWFLVLYRDPQGATSGGRIAQAAIAQQLWTADCAHNTIALLQVSYFSAAGASLGAEVVPSPERQSVDPSGSTIAAAMLSLLCARPYELDEVDYTSDAPTIRKLWLLSSKPSAPAQPRAAKPQAVAVAPAQSKTQKQFCDQILQLRSAASQDFRSIDLGPIKGEPAHIHATSINLVTSEDDCSISIEAGERPHYLCSWQHFYDEASNTYDDARIDAVGNMLASCLNVRPDWSENKDFMRLDSQGAQFSLDVVAGALLLSVERAQPGRPSAPTNNPAASTVPARAGGTAPATRGRPEFWMVGMTEDRHTMFFVDKASILRKPGGKAEFRREQIDKSSGKVAWLKQRSEIDCNRRISRDLEVFSYRDDETLIGAVQPAPEAAIRESTAGANILAFVCQGKEETAVRLATDESTIMFFAIEQ